MDGLLGIKQQHHCGGDSRCNGADNPQAQHGRPNIRNASRRFGNQFRIKRALVPSPIVSGIPVCPADKLVLRSLFGR
jgi:hypothetical protein